MSKIKAVSSPRRYIFAAYSAGPGANDDKDALMKLTDALIGEHAVIYDLFESVRDTVVNTNDVQVIHGVVSVLERLLLSHAKIEEELLFPRLEPHLGQMGPLAVMREEHNGLDDLLQAAKHETDADALKSVINRFLELAYGHFLKEERVLFVMARQFLDEATLTELGDEWAARRKVIVEGQDFRGAA